jgi:hypothetical protein
MAENPLIGRDRGIHPPPNLLQQLVQQSTAETEVHHRAPQVIVCP